MNDSPKCDSCGETIPTGSPGKLCPTCLLKVALQNDTETFISAEAQEDQETARLLEPGEKFGNYEIVRRLGRGGMGVVYEANQLDTGRRVALKVLGRSLENPTARQRFLREGRLAASINHPHSVYVFGTGEIDDVPIISMELVRSGTLEDEVRKNGPLKVTRAVDAILQVIDGLEAAREKGVLHRDVKPTNCFVELDGDVKIGDFGLSVSTQPREDISRTELTIAGQVLGTPAFASPEQLRGVELDVRSDIYSVGVTLFYLLTGETPFRGANLVQLLATVLEDPAPRANTIRSEIPTALSDAIATCLQKLPEQRFRDYASLKDALTPFSSEGATPALLGFRVVANVLDTMTMSVVSWIVMAIVFLLGGPSPLAMANISWKASFLLSLISYPTMILLYALPEYIWSTTPGKYLLSLKVIPANEGSPRFWRFFARSAIFVIFPSLYSILVSNIILQIPLEDRQTSPIQIASMFIGPIYILLLATLFSAARRKNGYAGWHDRIGKLRVIAKPRRSERAPCTTTEEPLPTNHDTATVGPFAVLKTLDETANAKLLLGYDAKLLRRVWIRKRVVNRLPVKDVVRNISRAGRLRWLASGDGETKSAATNNDSNPEPFPVWDAYEAPRGMSFSAAISNQPSWESLQYWLLDLAEELKAAEEENSLPDELTLDRLWIASDGRLKLLDFSGPNTSMSQGSKPIAKNLKAGKDPSVAFVSKAATAITEQLTATKQLRTLSFTVQNAIESVKTDSSLDAQIQRLTTLRGTTAHVSRLRRIGYLTLCLIMSTLMLFTFGLGGIVFSWQAENYSEIMELHRAASLLEVTERFDADKRAEQEKLLHIWIAGHHRTTVENEEIWNDPMAIQLFPGKKRKEIEEIALAEPPTAEELAAADLELEPLLKMSAQPFDALGKPQFAFGMTGYIWLMFVGIPGLFSALAIREGLFLRLCGLVVVVQDGRRASRIRMLWRALVPFPIAIGLAICSVTTMMPNPPALLWLWATLLFLLTNGLLLLSLRNPNRSISDYLSGTYLSLR